MRILFSGIGASIDSDIKEEVYTFMPEFSINLSKAAIVENFNHFLLLYDSDEVERESLGEELPTYKYEITETEDDYGKTTRTQTLITDDKGYMSIVEYRQTGGGILYAPTLLAMFQARQMSYIINDDLSEDEQKQIEKDMQTAFGELPDGKDGEVPGGYTNEVWDGLNGENRSGAGLLGLFETNSLMSLLGGMIKDGNISARTEYEYGDDFEKITVILEIPSFGEWGEIFKLNENQLRLAEDNETVINKILDDAGIPETERYISLDDKVQAALFVYFQGFFNLPVESSDLKPGGNGLFTILGERETIHRYGRDSNVYERGVTLNLNNPDTPVKLELLPVGGCLEEVYIYDVCENANIDPGEQDGLFHYPAVTFAFVINTAKFYEDYGFFFPIIKNDIGDMLYSNNDILTFYLEFSCLSRLSEKITERNIGQKLELYTGSEPFIIGYAHNGLPSEERGDLSPGISSYTHHIDPLKPTPHVCIKTAFSSGYPYIVDWG